jgi:hypothetical protein
MNQEQEDLVKSINFANEFIKIVRGFKLDQERQDSLPQEVKEYLANEHLNKLITDQGLEPEMLVWGLLHMIEILLKFADLQPNDLVEIIQRNNIGRVSVDGDQTPFEVQALELLYLLDVDPSIKDHCRTLYLKLFSPEMAVKQIVDALKCRVTTI